MEFLLFQAISSPTSGSTTIAAYRIVYDTSRCPSRDATTCDTCDRTPCKGRLTVLHTARQESQRGQFETSHSAGRSESQYGRHGKDSSNGLRRIQPLPQKPPGNDHADPGRQSNQGRNYGG